MTSGRDVWTLVALSGVFLADRLLKAFARTTDGPIELGPIFAFRPTENTGIAFSLPFSSTFVTALTTAIVLVLVSIGVRRWLSGGRWMPWALLAVGGGSNLLDRLRHGAVTDYLDLATLPIFNLADVLVVTGLILLLTPRLTGGAASR